MKNLKIIALFILMLVAIACKKEVIEPTPTPTPEPVCNCGTITNDGITDDCYWLDVRNDCSSNVKRFCFDYSFWLTAYVGTDVCVTNQEPW